MSMFTLAIFCLTTSSLPWFMDLTFQVPMQYCFFIASDFTSINSHIYIWVLFFLWLHLFILSGVISPLFSSSILGTYQSGDFIFQCHTFLPFQSVHGVLKARILKWFANPFSSGWCFVIQNTFLWDNVMSYTFCLHKANTTSCLKWVCISC